MVYSEMIKDRDFIVFSDDWGRHPFSCQHIMKHFLPDNRIIWVNTIGMRRPRFTFYDVKRGVEKILSWISPRQEEQKEGNLTVLSPFMIPYNTISLIRSFNRFSVIGAVRTAMKRFEFKDPILIATLPNAADYLGAFRESLDVYYCVDEFSEWPGVDKNLVREMESILVKNVHFIVAVSDELQRNKKSPRGPTYLLTHGVDLEHFSKASLPHNIPKEVGVMEGIPKPIIGFWGLFDERSDQEILENILIRHSEWSLVIIGKSMVSIERLKKYKNFYYINAVSYSELPRYASYFDTCIVPYVRNTLTDNISPLKLKEYLATGKPIVSTALPETMKYRQWVNIANNEDEFVTKIEESIDKKVDISSQIAAVRNEDWQNKALLFSSYIEDALETVK